MNESDDTRPETATKKRSFIRRFWPPNDTAMSILGAILILVVYPFVVSAVAWFWSDHRAVAREREKAVHQNAGEYYIDPNTFEKQFRYHQPIAAPTPFGRLEAYIPPWE